MNEAKIDAICDVLKRADEEPRLVYTNAGGAKVWYSPDGDRKKPWRVQYRAHFWRYKTEAEAREAADKYK